MSLHLQAQQAQAALRGWIDWAPSPRHQPMRIRPCGGSLTALFEAWIEACIVRDWCESLQADVDWLEGRSARYRSRADKSCYDNFDKVESWGKEMAALCAEHGLRFALWDNPLPCSAARTAPCWFTQTVKELEHARLH